MQPTLKIRYSLREFCELTGTSRSKAIERINRGELAVVKDGRHCFILREEALRYAAASLPAVNPRREADQAA